MREEKDFDATIESLKCANQPQRANGSTYGFKCCHHHVVKLIEKGLKVHQIDEYIDWKWCQKKIKAIELKINKLKRKNNKNNKNKDEHEEDKLNDQINRINKFINKEFAEEDIHTFKSISNYANKIRRSPRKKSNKQLADLAECMQMENENELLESLEEWLGEKNLNSEQLQYSNRMYNL